MKRILAFTVGIAFLFAGCGSLSDSGADRSAEASTRTVLPAQTQLPDDALSANDTNGTRSEICGIPVTDDSVSYRTQDSYRLESVAVQAVQDAFRASAPDAKTVLFYDGNFWNCSDDGENVYYTVHLNASYMVDSGERIRQGFFYDVGVRKADETAFDASDVMEEVGYRYSVFAQRKRDAVIESDIVAEDTFEDAARTIAQRALKDPDSGKIIRVQKNESASDEICSVFDVLCEGENDFGMHIPCVYSVYLQLSDGKIREIDPAETE